MLPVEVLGGADGDESVRVGEGGEDANSVIRMSVGGTAVAHEWRILIGVLECCADRHVRRGRLVVVGVVDGLSRSDRSRLLLQRGGEVW